MGRLGEEAAARYMEGLGFLIIGRNVHVGHSEFDIICTNDKYIIFVEVKTRNLSPSHVGRYGPPERAVDRNKKEYLMRGVRQYLRENDLKGRIAARIDVIEVYASDEPEFCVRKLKHHKAAVWEEAPKLPYRDH